MEKRKNRYAGRLVPALLSGILLLAGCSYVPQEIEVIGSEGDSSRLSQEPYVPVYEESNPEEEARRRREAAAEAAAAAYAEAQEEEKVDPSRRTMADTLNLRDAPGTDSVVIALVPVGAYVYLLGEEEDGWYPVRYGDLEGYVKSGFFEEDRQEEEEEEEAFEEEPEVKEGRILDDEDPEGGPGSEESVPEMLPQETPAEEPPAEESPAAEVPAAEAPAAETPAAEAPAEEQITELPPEITQ